jgi:hypothetical protein
MPRPATEIEEEAAVAEAPVSSEVEPSLAEAKATFGDPSTVEAAPPADVVVEEEPAAGSAQAAEPEAPAAEATDSAAAPAEATPTEEPEEEDVSLEAILEDLKRREGRSE